MNRRLRRCLLLLAVAGCTPAKLTLLQAPDEANRAEILIYRESALNALAMPMVFGADGDDYVVLKDGQYTRILVRPGTYNFFVRSVQADRPRLLTVELQARGIKCLRAYANPANIAKALAEPAYYLGSTFLVEAVSCPSPAELARNYSWVPIDYENEAG